jgi:predicted DNA-binding transcriptional regulator YafY
MRATRLLELILLLQRRGQTTAKTLAGELGVTERTIYRDLEALSTAGIPVYTQGGPGGGCGLPDQYRTLLTGVSPSDIEVVLKASNSGALADLGLDKKVQLALHKLIVTLPIAQRQAAALGRQRLHLDSAAWFRKTDSIPFLPLIQEAVETSQLVRLSYRRTDDQERERVLAPLGLVAKASIWYVVGMVEEQLRVYRVSRILEAVLLPTPFTRPADFDLASYWAEWCSKYEANLPRYITTLEIAPQILESLQSSFVSTVVEHQAIEAETPDKLLFKVTFETIEAATNWVLSWGAAIKVLEPVELRERVRLQSAQTLALYI